MRHPTPDPRSPSRRRATLAALFALVGCGGGGDEAPTPQPGPPPGQPSRPPPGPPVDGPPWRGFAGDAQHTALSAIASQPLATIAWSTPVDLAPRYTGSGALLAHYGSPVITRRNTVVLAVKNGDAFVIEARAGGNGSLLWSLETDVRLPPHDWVPSVNLALAGEARVLAPAAGGRVLIRDDADAASGATRTVAFYGDAAYAAASATYDATVFINTPLTTDSQGNAWFGFTVTGTNPLGLQGGIARIGADGSTTFTTAAAASGDAAMAKTATNAAPALSLDERTVYAVVNNAAPAGTRAFGRIVALDAVTLAPRASTALLDPLTGTAAWVSDNASSSPTVGPDGHVYLGVLEANAPAHSFRGWLLHFDAALSAAGAPGSFGWDNTVSIVPRAMLPLYAGQSAYLLLMKSNSYGGIGLGDGRHRVAIVDPKDRQPDAFSSATVMREVISVLGPTPSSEVPGGVEEWCINTAAVDPATQSVLMNSEDGRVYRWHLPTNTLSENIAMNNGYAQAYTPTAIGPDGRVYAVNNARLFSIGAS